jgi:hypothetical protein
VIYKKKKITIVLGLESRVVTVGIRALGMDPEDH